ncbi:uncharacterized protein YALI1_E01865g [Yarrowia lipolytica]|jgi:hypothetical protein|uniref:Uncharacterized protein n=1 Tax=Yarrowia lipolytica TaxID=4952 RepID=A0A1D8NGP5_YARLL|nr:hypothetical protein YALI1_E01865g [Yarrowia lipolytica]
MRLEVVLSVLEDTLNGGSLHDVALNLELAGHEESLGVSLTLNELLEVVVRESELDVSITLGGLVALADVTVVLEVKVPRLGLASLVLEVEDNDGVGLLDGLSLLLGLRGVVKTVTDDVEDDRRSEAVDLERHCCFCVMNKRYSGELNRRMHPTYIYVVRLTICI